MRSKESLSIQLIRLLESFAGSHSVENPITVHLDAQLAFYLLSHKRGAVDALQGDKGAFFLFSQDHSLNLGGFRITNKEGVVVADGAGTLLAETKSADKKKALPQKDSGRGKRVHNSSKNRNRPVSEDLDPAKEEEIIPQPQPATEPQDHKTAVSEDAPTYKEEGVLKNRRRRRRPGRNRRGQQGGASSEGATSDADPAVNTNLPSVEINPPQNEGKIIRSDLDSRPPEDKASAKDGWWKKLLD